MRTETVKISSIESIIKEMKSSLKGIAKEAYIYGSLSRGTAINLMKNILRYSNVSFPGDVAIFRDKVVILNWEDNPTAILIASKSLSEQY
ncbi:MAG: hypothetical protein QMD85_05855, partial [Candidatus Aenigmarchaeota archaeon]|nr:hypothetical protein [Candidatus Aenigmarchaeota archaeon]